jgi:hypothetical protein
LAMYDWIKNNWVDPNNPIWKLQFVPVSQGNADTLTDYLADIKSMKAIVEPDFQAYFDLLGSSGVVSGVTSLQSHRGANRRF